MGSPVGVKGRKWQATDDSVILEKNKKMGFCFVLFSLIRTFALVMSKNLYLISGCLSLSEDTLQASEISSVCL